jgi:hypothetical protein
MDRGANCTGGLRKGEPTRPERLSMKLKTCLATAAFAAWIPFITFGDPCPPG